MNILKTIAAVFLIFVIAVVDWNDQRKLRAMDGYYPEGEE